MSSATASIAARTRFGSFLTATASAAATSSRATATATVVIVAVIWAVSLKMTYSTAGVALLSVIAARLRAV